MKGLVIEKAKPWSEKQKARLQGFPDWYPVSDDLPVARRHIGNAVPPLMAAAVVWRVAAALGDLDDGDLPEALALALDKGTKFGQIGAAIPRLATVAKVEACPQIGTVSQSSVIEAA